VEVDVPKTFLQRVRLGCEKTRCNPYANRVCHDPAGTWRSENGSNRPLIS
jgi:hypothetical protein